MRSFILGLAIVAVWPSAQGSETFTGVITDSMCAAGDHSVMRMGATGGECTIACVEAHGAQYVLYTGKDFYVLSEQRSPEKFAGKRVTVRGTLKTGTSAKTIQVDSITAVN
jgi:hypothetical protein